MTSPVPDALRTQLAEAFFLSKNPRCDFAAAPEAVRQSWLSYADRQLVVFAPFLARARVEGAAEALRGFESWAQEQADQRLHNSPVQVGERSGLLMTAMHARGQRAALSASTTTEGDPT